MVCATYGDGNYFPPSFHRLISNRFSHRPEPFLWSKGTGLHICALPLHKRGKVGAKESPDLIWNHWSLPVLKWRWKEEAAHNPSDMWCPLLCLLKFCGWEGKQSVGLADTFLLCKCTTVGKLSASHWIKNSQRQRPYLPSLLCMMPDTLWMVNKCHVIFILH